MFMHLDINSEIYPLQAGQKFALLLVPTLNPEGKQDTGFYAPVFYLVLKSYILPLKTISQSFVILCIL